MGKRMAKCKTCGVDIAKNAKTCPVCGAKNAKPIYKRVWFWVLMILAISAIGSSGGSEEEQKEVQQQEQVEISYASYTVKQLMKDLDENALKAENTYQDQYVELSGTLNVIDSDGRYISLVPTGDAFAIIGVQCYMQNEEQVEQVMEMSVGDTIVVRGQITDIGEIMGYTLDIDQFVK